MKLSVKPTRSVSRCREVADLAILYAASELIDERDRAVIEAHVRECAHCAVVLKNEKAFYEGLAEKCDTADQLDTSGLVLARCRRELSQALDREPIPPAKARRSAFSAGWIAGIRDAFVFRPGWSAAALLLAGMLIGSGVRAWYREAFAHPPGSPAMIISAAAPLKEQDLPSIGVDAINVDAAKTDQQSGVAAPKVELRLHAGHPMVLEGSIDDAEIQHVLMYVVQHANQFDPNVRLDSVDVLRTRAADPQIRDALCDAAQRDPNPAVRLKAFQALDSLGADHAVQQALLHALAADGNAGVRVEVANQLLAAFGDSQQGALPLDNEALGILRDRMQHDPNKFVRMTSATVLTRAVAADDGSDTQGAGITGSPHP